MKTPVAMVGMFVLGLGLGAVVPWVRAAPRVGDNKFDNEFVKKFVGTPEKPMVLRAQGQDYTVVGTLEVQDDYVGFQTKTGQVWLRVRDIGAVSQ